MNKADLVNLVAARTELTKTDVSLVVDAAIETIIDSVVEGKKVSILGFGSFEPRERSARQGLTQDRRKDQDPAKRVLPSLPARCSKIAFRADQPLIAGRPLEAQTPRPGRATLFVLPACLGKVHVSPSLRSICRRPCNRRPWQSGYRGRFAPTPSGPLHLGNLRTALVSWLLAREAGGAWLLRIDDLDTPRVRPGAIKSVLEDLRWLGLDWDGPVLMQSERRGLYNSVLSHLRRCGQLYACRCSRRDLAQAVIYPGPVVSVS